MNRKPSHFPVRALVGLAVVLGLAGCGHDHHGGAPTKPVARMLYSPNGEALTGGPLGQPKCQDAVAGWFARVDANHDGRVDRDEFLADARAQFAAMDIDRQGYLTAEELGRVRTPYRPANYAARASHQDPVMSADANLDFKVTPEEFLQQAEATFRRLDADHDGAIEAGELAPLCPAVETQPEQLRSDRPEPGEGGGKDERGPGRP